MTEVSLFHIGPQKAGTTWLYRCFAEHSEITVPFRDTIHYYDMFWHQGNEWYMHHFNHDNDNALLFDPTPSYIRSPLAARRIAKDNPNAKIMLTLRNPLERAFSHYWHEKKKGKITFGFEEVFSNYDLFSSWIETGFYAEHLERFMEYFPREQILPLPFEELQDDPKTFLHRALSFSGVTTDFTPTVLDRKINQAGVKKTRTAKIAAKVGAIGRKTLGDPFGKSRVGSWLSGKREYEAGIKSETRQRVLDILIPEIERTENLLRVDLSQWKR